MTNEIVASLLLGNTTTGTVAESKRPYLVMYRATYKLLGDSARGASGAGGALGDSARGACAEGALGTRTGAVAESQGSLNDEEPMSYMSIIFDTPPRCALMDYRLRGEVRFALFFGSGPLDHGLALLNETEQWHCMGLDWDSSFVYVICIPHIRHNRYQDLQVRSEPCLQSTCTIHLSNYAGKADVTCECSLLQEFDMAFNNRFDVRVWILNVLAVIFGIGMLFIVAGAIALVVSI